MNNSSMNSVFYADTYHPIQAGSIDGTDTLPHDNGVYRALLCSNAALYDAFGDEKVIGDPYCTLFVGRLSHLTNEDTLRKAMNVYGRIKDLRLVRHIVTGASCGYGFVEFESEKEMHRAYKGAHHSYIDDSEIIVDYNRQHLMAGWIPRRLGGGLGGKKESGQLRFGGRDRPFRAPLRPIPWDELKRLNIPTPPEGRYMSRFQVPSPPHRKRSAESRDAHMLDKRSASTSHHLGKPESPQNSTGKRLSYSEDREHKRHKEANPSRRNHKTLHSSNAASEERNAHRKDRTGSQHGRSIQHDRWTPSTDDLYSD